jgi:DMSO/TMAO reductase YedYZ molybdopterin-dependent catalytic subunit
MTSFSRRTFTLSSAAAMASLFASRAGSFPLAGDETLVPWLDVPPENPVPNVIASQLEWEKLDSFITPNDKFFSITHFDRPMIDPAAYGLRVGGLVNRSLTLSLADIRARPKQEVTFTIECSGNHGFPFFDGGIGNATWGGTPLAAVLDEAGVAEDGIEVVFWGADAADIALKDDFRDATMHQNFARSMSLAEAMSPDNLLCYEMNGADLPVPNGAPLRLIAPGWYGVANVKWLTRIEVRDRRFTSLMMGRNYVTIREEEQDGQTVWAETSVGRWRLKSAPAKVVRAASGYRVMGAAWGGDVASVEVRIDDGAWKPAAIDTSESAKFAWKLWSFDWPDAAPGEHRVTSRAIDAEGQVQPAMDDPLIARKHSIWESNGQITRRVAIPA